MAKYGTASACNPGVDFPVAGKLANAELKRGLSVVVEENFVDKSYVANVVRWAGFELDSPRLSYVWLDLAFEQTLARKPDSKFPKEKLRAEHQKNILHHWKEDAARAKELKDLAKDVLDNPGAFQGGAQ